MVVRWVRLLLVLTAGFSAIPAAAAVSAQLSAQNIDELETVLLTIKITETRQSQTLDLTSLETDFHVMNTNTISQSRYLNGRGQSWVDYQITLQPKRTGTLIIPSIAVGSEHTPSLKLQVHPLSAQTRTLIDDLVFFENAVSSNTIYVQSQLILTRRLLYSQGVQLYSDLPGAPEIANAVVLTLGETRSGTTERNGNTYGVVEQQYAIFPETSGTFTVPGISITASVRLVENNRVSRKGVRVGTAQEDITVLPVPAAYPANEPWLPAQNVQLFDVVTPDLATHEVGDTLTHELLIHIDGNIGSISPPLALDLNSDEFRVYPQAPVIEDDAQTATVKGSRLQTNSIVPLQPGLLQLPASTLVWWDTVNKEVRVSKTTARTLSITGQPVAAAKAPAAEDVTSQETPETIPGDAFNEIDWKAALTYLTVIITVILVFAGLLVLRRNMRFAMPRRARTRQQLQNAFKSSDAGQIHAALSTYLAEIYDCPRYAALAQFRETATETANALEELERCLYAAQNNTDAPDQAHLAAQIKQLKSAIEELGNAPAHEPVNPLPDLYPHQS